MTTPTRPSKAQLAEQLTVRLIEPRMAGLTAKGWVYRHAKSDDLYIELRQEIGGHLVTARVRLRR